MRSWDTSLKHSGECMVGALLVLVTAPIIHWAAATKVYYLWAKVLKLCCVLSLFWFCLQLKTLPQTRKYSKQGIELCNEISGHIYQFSEFKVQNSRSNVLILKFSSTYCYDVCRVVARWCENDTMILYLRLSGNVILTHCNSQKN